MEAGRVAHLLLQWQAVRDGKREPAAASASTSVQKGPAAAFEFKLRSI